MRKLVVFNQLSLDGYFTDRNGDMSWAKENADDEFDEFTSERAGAGGVLLFGRLTYELMANYWPTPQAAKSLPLVAERMNNLPKVVFSRTLKQAAWRNTTLVRKDVVGHIRRMKEQPGPGMAVMGSGSIVAQLAGTNLVDEYEIILNPLAIGAGRSMFEGMRHRLGLRLTEARTFRSGRVFLSYQPA